MKQCCMTVYNNIQQHFPSDMPGAQTVYAECKDKMQSRLEQGNTDLCARTL